MAAPSDELIEVFQQGLDARAAGLSQADNPYGPGVAEHREWRAGWNAVCDLDEDDDPLSTRAGSLKEA